MKLIEKEQPQKEAHSKRSASDMKLIGRGSLSNWALSELLSDWAAAPHHTWQAYEPQWQGSDSHQL